jgi:hypothetical protein
MTREQVRTIQQQIDHARRQEREAESVAEIRAFADKAFNLYRQIKPYLEGRLACSDEQREAA